MKFRFYNLLLIGSIVSLVMLSSCNKDEEDSSSGLEDGSSSLEYGSFTDNRDSTEYKTIKIGEQIWLAENLSYTGDNGFQQQITDNNEWKLTDAGKIARL